MALHLGTWPIHGHGEHPFDHTAHGVLTVYSQWVESIKQNIIKYANLDPCAHSIVKVSTPLIILLMVCSQCVYSGLSLIKQNIIKYANLDPCAHSMVTVGIPLIILLMVCSQCVHSRLSLIAHSMVRVSTKHSS